MAEARVPSDPRRVADYVLDELLAMELWMVCEILTGNIAREQFLDEHFGPD